MFTGRPTIGYIIGLCKTYPLENAIFTLISQSNLDKFGSWEMSSAGESRCEGVRQDRGEILVCPCEWVSWSAGSSRRQRFAGQNV